MDGLSRRNNRNNTVNKYCLLILIIITATFHLGCLQKESRSYFSNDGIKIGNPKKIAEGGVFIPLVFKTAIIHSAQKLHDLKWSENNGVIDVTAIINVPPFSKSKIFPGGVYLKNPKLKSYKLRYKDPDGTTHDLGEIKISE